MAIIEVTESGIKTTNQNDILQQLITIFKGVYGENTYVVEGTEDYNMLVALADLLSDMGMVANSVSNGFNLSTATGFQLDNIATIFYNNVNRRPATYSTVNVNITGTPNTTIVSGQVKDITGGIWNLINSTNGSNTITIGEDGTTTALAVQTVAGAYYIEAEQISGFNSIVTPVAGWTNVTNPTACTIGQNVESDAQFRYRLAVAAQGTSKSVANTLYTNLIGTDGISSVSIWENDTVSPLTIADVGLTNITNHSIVVSVYGNDGTDTTNEEIAKAIYNYKGTGVGTFAPIGAAGSVSINLPNEFNQTQMINFVNAQGTNTYVDITLLPLTTSSLSADLISAIQSAVSGVINELKIGGKLYATELYVPISTAITNVVGANAYNIQSVTIGTSENPTGTEIQYLYNQKPITTDTFITVGV